MRRTPTSLANERAIRFIAGFSQMIIEMPAEILKRATQCNAYNSRQIAALGAPTFHGFARVKYEIGAIPRAGNYAYAIAESFR